MGSPDIAKLADAVDWDADGQCRRCTECPDSAHHWLEDFDDGPWEYAPEPRPRWGCKHCDFSMPYEDDEPQEQYESLLAHVRELAARVGKNPELDWIRGKPLAATPLGRAVLRVLEDQRDA